MAIDSTYKKILIDSYLKALLKNGVALTAPQVEGLIENFESDKDFTKPQFVAEDHMVEKGEASSASKQRATLDAIYADMRAIFSELRILTTTAIRQYERWDSEYDAIEKTLVSLEDRIGDLTLIAQDTEGYVNFVLDDFKDLSRIDQTNTTVTVNPALRVAGLFPKTRDHKAIYFDIDPKKDISFRATSKLGAITQNNYGGALENAFSDLNTYWQTKLSASKQGVVTGELLVKLGDTATSLSKIEFVAHSSNYSSPLEVTPLYSFDGYNFEQLPGKTVSLSIRDSGTFIFQPVEATYIKFLLTKRSADYLEGGKFVYEFGAKLIQFFKETFTLTLEDDEIRKLISKPLSITDAEGSLVEFSKLRLETCEVINEGTNIRYFVTVSNDSSVPIDGSPEWVPVDPVGRTEKESGSVIDVGDLSSVEIGDDETVVVSYDATGNAAQGLQNPSGSFYLVSYDSGTSSFINTSKTALVNRYMLINSNDRILNYQLKSPKDSSVVESDDTYFLVDMNEFEIFRNIGERGVSDLVRETERGWGFDDPYYFCVVEIDNSSGLLVDTGDFDIWVDNRIKSGKVTIPYGTHRIKVYKDYWYDVTPELTTLSALIAADPLYPHNLKLLIEGYDYGAGFNESEKIYQGADVFAECLMKKVSVFDFANNIAEDDYEHYAIDWDIPDSYSNDCGNMLFMVKINEDIDDSDNEQFLVRFKAVDQKFKYLRLRADFETEDANLTPMLTSYKIKLG